MGTRRFELDVPAPFRLDLAVWTLRRRSHNAVDEWDGRTWRRSMGGGDGTVGLAVRQERAGAGPRLVVTLDRSGVPPDGVAVADARRLVTRALGLGVDLTGFYALAGRDPRLSALARRFLGMRPPRSPSVFEALVNAVACQQLSLDVGIHLLNRLARRFGPTSPDPDGPPALPGPGQLAGVDVGAVRALGFSGAKARTLVGLARKVVASEIDLEALEDVDDASVRDMLTGLPGIGRWSAEYTLLRGLGRLEVLPGDDVGAQNNLRRRFGLGAGAGYDAVIELSRSWAPYGGLVYFHLLLDALADRGCVEPTPVPG